MEDGFISINYNKFSRTIIYLLIFITIRTGIKDGLCASFLSDKKVDMKKNVSNEDRYKNMSSAESCIRVIIKDSKTGKNINMIFGNMQFARLIAEQRGLINKKGKIKNNEEYFNFLNKEYLKYMVENEEQPIQLSIDLLEKIKKNTPNLIYDKPLSFRELKVKNEAELLETYFLYKQGHGILKNEYNEQLTRNSAFIAFLIDLGYDVVWGDFVFNLNIYTEPFSARYKVKKSEEEKGAPIEIDVK